MGWMWVMRRMDFRLNNRMSIGGAIYVVENTEGGTSEWEAGDENQGSL